MAEYPNINPIEHLFFDSQAIVVNTHMWLSRRPRAYPYPVERSSFNVPGNCIHFMIPMFDIIHPSQFITFQKSSEEEVETVLEDRPWLAGKLYGDKQGRYLRYGACSVSCFLPYVKV
jgi:hypothetical protein